MSKILIFGGNGFLGSYLVKYLKDFFISDVRLNFENWNVINDLVKNFSQVICCVGRTRGPGINNIDYLENNLNENLRDNLYAQLMLAQICQKNGKHLTCINTGCIYTGDNKTEEDTPNFTGSSYSTVKGYLDQLLNHMEGVLNLRIKMPITGDNDCRCLVNKLIKYKSVTDIQNSMSFIPDIFPLAVKLISEKKTGCFNMVNSGTISNKEIVEMYREFMNPQHVFEVDGKIPTNRSNAILSNNKLKNILGIVDTDIKDSIRELFKTSSKQN